MSEVNWKDFLLETVHLEDSKVCSLFVPADYVGIGEILSYL
jgi:hypothetical protein